MEASMPLQVRVPTVNEPSISKVPVDIVMMDELAAEPVTLQVSEPIANVPPETLSAPPMFKVLVEIDTVPDELMVKLPIPAEALMDLDAPVMVKVLFVTVAPKLDMTTSPEADIVLAYVLLNVPALVKSEQLIDAPVVEAL